MTDIDYKGLSNYSIKEATKNGANLPNETIQAITSLSIACSLHRIADTLESMWAELMKEQEAVRKRRESL